MHGVLLWTLVMAFALPAWGQTVVIESGIRVHVQGMVKRPGLYRLFPGARRADAIQAAGGVLPGAHLEGLSLALALNDGESLVVPKVAPPAPTAVPRAKGRRAARAEPARPTSAHPLNLNTASLAQLDALPGIGPSLASDIVGYRSMRGRFRSLDELREVAGIGEARLRRLKPLLRL